MAAFFKLSTVTAGTFIGISAGLLISSWVGQANTIETDTLASQPRLKILRF